MPTYPTLDFLPDLTVAQMTAAQRLGFGPASPNTSGWDNEISFSTTEPYALLRDTFVFTAKAGATYHFASSSFFDPFLIQVYDNLGNVVAVNQEDTNYGMDFLVNFVAPYSGDFYISAGWDQGTYNSFVALLGYEDVDTIPTLPWVRVDGTSGNDTFTAYQNHEFHGGAGLDVVNFANARSNYSVMEYDGHIRVTNSSGELMVAYDVERFKFIDSIVSFETTGPAATAYRLYKAAFDRAPDAAGLGFWIRSLEHGTSLTYVANEFVNSNEFKDLVGSNPTDETVLTTLYKNVLHRAPDQAGYDYWLKVLGDNSVSLADMLIAFSESPENQAQVIGSLQAGFEFWY